MRFRWTLFGREITTLEFGAPSAEESLAELVAGLVEEDAAVDVGGGYTHNFERDTQPLDPDDRYAPWDRFGFRK